MDLLQWEVTELELNVILVLFVYLAQYWLIDTTDWTLEVAVFDQGYLFAVLALNVVGRLGRVAATGRAGVLSVKNDDADEGYNNNGYDGQETVVHNVKTSSDYYLYKFLQLLV